MYLEISKIILSIVLHNIHYFRDPSYLINISTISETPVIGMTDLMVMGTEGTTVIMIMGTVVEDSG